MESARRVESHDTLSEIGAYPNRPSALLGLAAR
jgi:hypothetical protein